MFVLCTIQRSLPFGFLDSDHGLYEYAISEFLDFRLKRGELQGCCLRNRSGIGWVRREVSRALGQLTSFACPSTSIAGRLAASFTNTATIKQDISKTLEVS